MLGRTPRQRAVVAAVLLVAAATAVAGLLGRTALAAAGLAVLLALSLLVVLDLRSRTALLDRRLRRAPATTTGSAAELRTRVAELEEQLAAATRENARLDDLSRASYRQAIRQHVRTFRTEDRLGRPTKSPALQLPHKLRTLELAASHGVAIPEVYAVWPDVDAIDLSSLPDSFVLKADGGAGSVAVFPLRRQEDGRYQLVGAQGDVDEDEMRERIRGLGRAARPPFFAEELLHAADDGPIPDDAPPSRCRTCSRRWWRWPGTCPARWGCRSAASTSTTPPGASCSGRSPAPRWAATSGTTSTTTSSSASAGWTVPPGCRRT